ncbi:HoxN/HupN/NixA family nickel/cobalt transporter [Gordonia sp. VNK21]|uniref:HoxN/HupN/NixA family nickel/cobalt transporter n=1 Tax=Gordonia sp. VNK21 TaxID=3382483 RepID=UPI0038D3B81A
MTVTTGESRLSDWRVAAGVIAVLHVAGFGVLLAVVLPSGVAYGSGGGGLSAVAVGLGAYALGMRHAFDADHIAAIDNTTRRLLRRGRPSTTVGLWFSLGHSSVVMGLCVLLIAGLSAIGRTLDDDSSALHTVTGVWGPVVSALFLLVIAGVNAWSLRGGADAPAGGPVWRLVGRMEQVIDRPSRMFGVGLAFGLGFDTATEIGLLALAGGAAVSSAPWWAVLALPLLFAAGMSLLDTAQGAVMRRAYGWPGGSNYRLTMTLISAAAALAIAGVQLAGVGAERLGLGGPVGWVAGIDLETAGIGLTVVLLCLWAVVFVRVRRLT